jgi:hypothetical protein
LWLSPIGFLGHFGRKSSETLDFPGKRRKRHAETTESSGKSGMLQFSRLDFGRRRPSVGPVLTLPAGR